VIEKPRTGYAKVGEDASLYAPVRYLPIVIVPGMAGSRLTDPVTGKLAWNPLGKPLGKGPGVFAVDYDRLQQITAELVPDETHGWDEDDPNFKDAAQIKHITHGHWTLYSPIAIRLSKLATEIPGLSVKPKIYLAGYDWRQDNAKSALRLAAVVEEALAETRERQVILIAHSNGCLVSRYYCRVLGGESKVHRLFFLGGPNLGAPQAYIFMKDGPPGIYAKDMYEDAKHGQKGKALAEGVMEGGQVVSGVTNWAMNPKMGAQDGATGITGDLFIAMCLGAGRLLSRDETISFFRKVTGLYQNLPTSIFCRDFKNWLIFDPAATGLPPTGFMIVLPSLFDALTDVLGSGFASFFRPDDADRTSPEANRNWQSLQDRVEAIGKAFAGQTDYTPVGQTTETGASKIIDNEKHAILMSVELVFRLLSTFVDNRSVRQTYADIYTGLLDTVELRAVCAANLAVCHSFDDALTVYPNPEPGESALEFVATSILLPAVTALIPPLGNLINDKLSASAAKDAKKKKKALVYMPPRTTTLYCSNLPVDAGVILVPIEQISNDDSNLVDWMMVPLMMLPAAILALAGGTSFATNYAQFAKGDGTVPTYSACPPSEILSTDFVSKHSLDGMVVHRDLPTDTNAIQAIIEEIKDLVPDFLAT
jgi:pimeloyl-ACP methyl ester carboxylesterase